VADLFAVEDGNHWINDMCPLYGVVYMGGASQCRYSHLEAAFLLYLP